MKTVIINNLEWQYEDDGVKRNWSEAKEHASTLGEGWRLPTIQELKSLVDYNKLDPACTELLKCRSDFYWSSTKVSGNLDCAWVVFFLYGVDGWYGEGLYGVARYVRTVNNHTEEK